ncbi:MAG: hypothetical protein JXO22_08830 [Phycisphaerae bacterium]|nr:hypothetical protein [Phycisphaerae bacterium]
MPARTARLTPANTFAALMAVAFMLALLPVSITGWIRTLGWPLIALQGPVRSVTLSAKSLFDTVDVEGLSAAQIAELRQENEALRRQIIAYDQAFVAMDRRVAEVTNLSQRLTASGARIIIARVVGPGLDSRTDVLRVSKGSQVGVQVGQWVAAGSPAQEGMTGRELLSRECIIGRISEVRPHESIVQLASDHRFKERVRIGRLARDDGGWFWATDAEDQLLEGVGDGRLLIRQATRDYPGGDDWMVIVPESRGLPNALAIGRITDSTRVDATQLHFDLSVQPFGRARDLEYVYIVDVGS